MASGRDRELRSSTMPLDHAQEFALSFTAEAVHLLRRKDSVDGTDDWQAVGSVEFTSPNFRADMVALRQMASGQDATSLPVVLIIPQDQILYTSLSVPTGPARQQAVGQALDGLTPYQVDELSFDWTDEGGNVRVAAVARQTLLEAREFAERHGFVGAGYSAQPQEDEYLGTPYFSLEEAVEDPAPDLSAAPLSLDLEADTAEDEPAAPISDEATPEAEQPILDGFDLPEAAAAEAVQTATEEDEQEPAEASESADDQPSLFDEATDQGDDTLSAGDAVAVAEPARQAEEHDVEDADFEEVESLDSEDDTAASDEHAGDGLAEVDHVEEAEFEDSAESEVDADSTDDAADFEEEEEAADEEDADAADDAEFDDSAEFDDETDQIDEEPDEEGVDDDELDEDLEDADLDDNEAELDDEDLDEKELDDDLTEAERDALAAASAEVAAAEAAAQVASARRIETASGTTVVRHGAPSLGAAGHRVAADHDEDAGAVVSRRKLPGTRGGLVELVAMLGALVVGLLLVWAFFVPSDNPAQLARDIAQNNVPAVTEPEQQPETEPQVEPEVVAPAVPAEVEPAPATDLSAEPVPSENEAPAPLPTEHPEITTPEAPATPATTPSEPAFALSPVEQALVVAAATEPLEAALRPVPRPAAPAPAASAPEEPASPAAQVAATQPAASQAPAQQPAAPAARAAATRPAATATTAPARTAAPAAARPALASSARPVGAPRRRAAAPTADTPPRVPSDPLPYEASQREPVRPAAVRPASRPQVRPARSQPAPAATPAPAAEAQPRQAPAAQETRASGLRSSSRPPSRPEGAIPDTLADEPLTPAEQNDIRILMRDLLKADAGDAAAALPQESYRVAEARPARRPAGHDGAAVRSDAVDDAVRAAASATPPPVSRPDSPGDNLPPKTNGSTMPARVSGGLLDSSARPRARPAKGGGSTQAGVEAAVAEAVAGGADAATPAGSMSLAALTTSGVPPRRPKNGAATQDTATSAAAAPAAEEPAADPAQSARRELDEQLQAQAEARIRARAAADAAAEAQARAQAEARARAQVEAEQRAAAARRQTYKPQELDEEPEVQQQNVPAGRTAATVASAATQKRGLNTGRTTIIGIIGAGKASRALIRLRSGKIVTVRLGDKIDGGTINSIGDGKITYVKSGRLHELRMLNER